MRIINHFLLSLPPAFFFFYIGKYICGILFILWGSIVIDLDIIVSTYLKTKKFSLNPLSEIKHIKKYIKINKENNFVNIRIFHLIEIWILILIFFHSNFILLTISCSSIFHLFLDYFSLLLQRYRDYKNDFRRKRNRIFSIIQAIKWYYTFKPYQSQAIEK